MQLRRVRPEEEPMRRYLEALWLPYHRELGDTVEAAGLTAELDFEAELEYQCSRFDSAEEWLWIALDDIEDSPVSIAETDATFAGFLCATYDPAPSSFEEPDRLLIGDFYVKKSYRGDGLADTLVERAVQAARENGCSEVALDVDVDNDRALAYYEKLGFDVARHRMRVSVDEIDV